MGDRVSADRGRERGQGELDRRVSGHSATSDGSGAWGADAGDRGLTDYANRQMWYTVAAAADTMGLNNAARHMRHYLDNTGATLTFDADTMLRDEPGLQAAYRAQVSDAQAAAESRVAALSADQRAAGTSFHLEGPHRSDVYSSTRDWYYAIGGFTYYYSADVRVLPASSSAARISTEPGPANIEMTIRLEVRDRYNWDHGKSVQLAGMTVTDDQLGRLHRVGLAREYNVQGTSSSRVVSWTATGDACNPATMRTGTGPLSREAGPPQARPVTGGRADPTRQPN